MEFYQSQPTLVTLMVNPDHIGGRRAPTQHCAIPAPTLLKYNKCLCSFICWLITEFLERKDFGTHFMIRDSIPAKLFT